MKKQLLLITGLVLTGWLSAQFTNIATPVAKLVEKYEPQRNTPTSSSDRGVGQVHWSNDFTSVSGWVTSGPIATSSTHGWSVGNTLNGWWGSQVGGDMGTSGDFARFINGDPTTGSPAPHNGGPFVLEYTNPINLAGVPSPFFEFQQFGARFYTLMSVEVSTNGGTSWTEVGNNNDIPVYTSNSGAPFGHPELRSYSIGTAIASNPSNVTFRFLWDGAMDPGGVTNYGDYAWYVDDIEIVEGIAYDAVIEDAFFRSGLYEYYYVPTSQIASIDFSGAVFQKGGATHTGMHLQSTVTKGGTLFNGTSNSVNLAAGGRDTLSCATSFLPVSGKGLYLFDWTFAGTNAETFNTNDETMVDGINITDSVYARDNGVEAGVLPNITGNENKSFQFGNFMETFGNGYINSVSIKISGSPSNINQQMSGNIYLSTQTGYTLVGQTDIHKVGASDLNKFVHIPLINPVEIQPGEEYLICAAHTGGEVEFGYAQSTYDQSIVVIDEQNNLYSLVNDVAAMVRINISESITIKTDTTICEGNVYTVGQSDYTIPGTYTDVLTSVNGNDSIIITTLAHHGAIDVVVDARDYSIAANFLTGDAYQWLDCNNNYAEIPGANQPIYSPIENGEYAVQIEVSGCLDTSECNSIVKLSLDKVNEGLIEVYPNPTTGNFTINFVNNDVHSINILDNQGKLIKSELNIDSNQYQVNDLELSPGIYFIEVISSDIKRVKKLVIK